MQCNSSEKKTRETKCDPCALKCDQGQGRTPLHVLGPVCFPGVGFFTPGVKRAGPEDLQRQPGLRPYDSGWGPLTGCGVPSVVWEVTGSQSSLCWFFLPLSFVMSFQIHLG